MMMRNLHRYFLDELILYSIEQRASDIHIEKYQDLCLFKFRVDGRLRIFFSFDEELFRVFSSFVKLISNLDMTQIRYSTRWKILKKYK